MHVTQRKILNIVDDVDLGEKSLREIGRILGGESAQSVKHHLEQLERKGLIIHDRDNNSISRIKKGKVKGSNLIVLPVLGSADCGPALMFADSQVEGHLWVSKKLVSRRKDVFAIKAVGNSMNKANVNGKTIEDGDYVIIDPNDKVPQNGHYILSIIGECANIKKFVMDEKNNQIFLLSESTADFPPICIHPEDFGEYLVNGRVIQVIKKPKIK